MLRVQNSWFLFLHNVSLFLVYGITHMFSVFVSFCFIGVIYMNDIFYFLGCCKNFILNFPLEMTGM